MPILAGCQMGWNASSEMAGFCTACMQIAADKGDLLITCIQGEGDSYLSGYISGRAIRLCTELAHLETLQ